MRHANWMASLALFAVAVSLAPVAPAWADGIASYKIVDLGDPYNLTDTSSPNIDESGNLTYSLSKNTGIYQLGAVTDPNPGFQNISLSYYLHAAGSEVNLLPPSMQNPSTGNAYLVNSMGLVIGSVGGQPVVYSAATGQFLTPQGLPGQSGSAYMGPINNLGQALGAQGDQLLFYSSPTAVPVPLTDLLPLNSGLTLRSATDINDLGDIVGVAFNAAGQETDYELIPTTAPEPTTLALISFGIVYYGGCRIRSRIA